MVPLARWMRVQRVDPHFRSLGAVENFEEESQMRKLIYRFLWNEDGAALVEYGMLIGLIAVVCLVAVTALGTEISTAFSKYVVGLAGI
jgi:pilus assembly protein Flp/PilA